MSDSYELPQCEACGIEYSLRDGHEPTPLCDACAHDAVESLRACIAELERENKILERRLGEATGAIETLERELASDEEKERLKLSAARYEIVRIMNAQQFADAYSRNILTGKPFDEIIDEQLPVRANYYDLSRAADSDGDATLGMIAFMAYHQSHQPPSEQEWRDRKDAIRWEDAAKAAIQAYRESTSASLRSPGSLDPAPGHMQLGTPTGAARSADKSPSSP